MTQIDLRKAPEGATHYANDPRCPDGIQWYLLSDGSPYKFWFSGRTSFWEEGAGSCVEPIANVYPITSTIWNCAGLPPAGSIRVLSGHTERLRVSRPEWAGREVKIYAHFVTDQGHELAAYVSKDHMIGGVGTAELFLPIRTPEQIVAEQRDIGIEAILTAYTYTVGPCTHKLARSQAERLYDAGIRKMMSDAEEVKS